jgi:hypothetical protein
MNSRDIFSVSKQNLPRIRSAMDLLPSGQAQILASTLNPKSKNHEKKYHIEFDAAFARLIRTPYRHRHALGDAEKRSSATLCRQRTWIRSGDSEQIQRQDGTRD